MKHYIYRITNIIESKHYYGVRSAKNPYNDLGKIYFSSSTNVKFIEEQKTFPERFKYKIISIYKTRKQAAQKEILLHAKFLVSTNDQFYNKANARSSGFSPLGYTHTPESLLKIAEAGRRPCKTSTRNKISQGNKNKLRSDEARKTYAIVNKGILANKFKGYYIYKNIQYTTAADLSLVIGLSKDKICKVSLDLDKIISKSSYSKTLFLNEHFSSEIIGMSWRDIGFDFININK